MSKIVTLTLNPALDKSSATDRLLPEQKLRCSTFQIDAGGGGINVSKGIQKLGGKSIAVFPVGGNNGETLKNILKEADISCKTLKIEGETRENISITELNSNLQYRFTLAGTPLTIKNASDCLDIIKKINPDYLVASGSLPPGLPETYFEEVAAFAKKIGARFILDTSGKPLHHAADEGVFLLKPNLGELSAMVGVEELAINQVDDAALEIIHKGKCEVVVVSLGPQGALLVTKEGYEHIPAPFVKKKSTVGAGDSMVSGMTWALSQGKSFREMAQLGVACGSAATMNQGTQLFKPEDVKELLAWIEKFGNQYRLTDF
jgi:6-phosphofructokinase 2